MGGETICEVMADYTGDITHCEAAGDTEGKRLAIEAWRNKAVQYISRSSANPEDVVRVAPVKKRKRLKSMHWGLALGDRLQFSTGEGLEQFELTTEKLETDPYKWPSLCIVPDQGPDGYCMINAMQYGWLHRVFLILKPMLSHSIAFTCNSNCIVVISLLHTIVS